MAAASRALESLGPDREQAASKLVAAVFDAAPCDAHLSRDLSDLDRADALLPGDALVQFARGEAARRLDLFNRAPWFHAAKSPDLRLPFHEAVLEPMLGAGMAWQTWRRGARALASQCTCPAHAAAAADAAGGARCSRFANMNVHRVWLRYGTQEEPQASRGWLGYDDHSKWGVTWGTKPQAFSTTSASCWPKWSGALQGDASQIRRGGGAVCSRDPALVRTLRRLVASVDRCGAPTPIAQI
jgi:hypothetical protein